MKLLHTCTASTPRRSKCAYETDRKSLMYKPHRLASDPTTPLNKIFRFPIKQGGFSYTKGYF